MLSLLMLATSGKMIVEMSRHLDTCDPQDLAIDSQGTTKMVYAYSNKQPIKNIPTQHTQRGTESIRLGAPGQSTFTPPEKDVTHFDIAYGKPFKVPFNSNVTGSDTTYYCGVFELPKQTHERQIIRFEPNIMPKINVATVHHILVFLCEGLNDSSKNWHGHCYDNGVPNDVYACNAGVPLGAWAVGGVGTTFPNHLGYPLYPSSNTQYVLMEIHYNNPNHLSVVDQSGIRFYTTGQLRQDNAGIISFGHSVDAVFTIPPGKQAYTTNAFCPGSCTSQAFPPGGIKIVSVLAHAHLAGRAVNFSIIRGGKEVEVIMNEKYYDFSLQDFETLPKEVSILPGDTVRSSCTYNTMDRTQPTSYGLTTHNEMCFNFAIYYPLLPANRSSTYCVTGNYSTISDNVNVSKNGNQVLCFGAVQNNVVISPSYKPLPAPPCKRTTVAANRQITMFNSLKGFNANGYAHNQYLDTAKTVKLYWTMDRAHKIIRMAAEVNKPVVGWMGLGFSPNGGMIGSDVVMAWVNQNSTSSTPKFSDRFASAERLPAVDKEQDYFDVIVRK